MEPPRRLNLLRKVQAFPILTQEGEYISTFLSIIQNSIRNFLIADVSE